MSYEHHVDAGRGFEPLSPESKSSVLPLDDPANDYQSEWQDSNLRITSRPRGVSTATALHSDLKLIRMPGEDSNLYLLSQSQASCH